MTNTREQLNQRLNQVGKDFRQVGKDVRQAGRHVWLAGLGAVGTIEERSRTVFDELARRGEKMDGKIDLEVFKPIGDAADRVKTFGQRLERQVEDGMSGALHRLGMPARTDVETLIERVDRLTEKVDGLSANN